PTVIAAVAVAGEGPAEIARGERCDIVREAELFHRALEREHALAEFSKEVGVRTHGGLTRAGRLACMQIITADLAEKDLAFHSETTAGGAAISGFDEPGDHA